MNMTLRVIIDILLVLGAFFTFVGVVGVIRMPDVFGRLQASTCIGSLGNIFLVLGGVAYPIGAMLYVIGKKKNKRYVHSIFHLFVVLGSLLHFFCVLFYVM